MSWVMTATENGIQKEVRQMRLCVPKVRWAAKHEWKCRQAWKVWNNFLIIVKAAASIQTKRKFLSILLHFFFFFSSSSPLLIFQFPFAGGIYTTKYLHFLLQVFCDKTLSFFFQHEEDILFEREREGKKLYQYSFLSLFCLLFLSLSL